jgi:hypothetical protein
MTRFLLPESIALEGAISLASLASRVERLAPKNKAVVAVRLGLMRDAWVKAAESEVEFWARAIAKAHEDKIYVGRCQCGPFFRFRPGVLSNPPEGLLADATARLAQVMNCPRSFGKGSIEAEMSDGYLWLHPRFCDELLRRNPSQREVDNVCDTIVARAVDQRVTYTRADFIAAVQSVLPDASKKQANEYWRQNNGPWKADPGRPRKKRV